MRAVQTATETLPLPARLFDGALTLARAELALVLVHTRELAPRVVAALLAAAFAQTALLVVLSPFLARAMAIEARVVPIVLSLAVAFAAAIGALLSFSWKQVHRSVSVEAGELSLAEVDHCRYFPASRSHRGHLVQSNASARLTPSVTLAERMSS